MRAGGGDCITAGNGARAPGTGSRAGTQMQMSATKQALWWGGAAAVLLLAAASMPVVPFGVRLSHRLDRSVLRRIFATVLMIVSIRMLIS